MAIIRKPPCEVNFKYTDGSKRKGKVIKATKPNIQKSDQGDYASRIELIKFEDGERNIRFAYWHRPKGKKGDADWNWASRTTWSFTVKETKDAIKEARKIGLFD